MGTFVDWVNVSVTGDCSNTNSGAFSFNVVGDAPGYTIYWVSPSGGTTVALTGPSYIYNVNGLSAGTYSFEIHDSSLPTNLEVQKNIYISSGTCVSLPGTTNTTCGLSNGALTAQTSNFYGSECYFYVYSVTNGYITSATSFNNNYEFTNLSADTYYVIANDGGGCTGSSETCIVKSSTTMSFGLYIVNDSPCIVTPGQGVGKIFVTGLTGTAPFTYTWSNGQTGSTATGLTSGSYSVTVTDSGGCTITSGTTVGFVSPVGIFGWQVITDPSCSGGDGELKVTITGGTAPYYYSLSNGFNVISYAQNYTFTGLSAGIFTLTVTDAALCQVTDVYNLLTPGSFAVISTTITNATCQGNNGSIFLDLLNSTPPITLQLSSTTQTQNLIYNTVPITIPTVAPGNYVLTITDAAAVCTNVQNITVGSTSSFNVQTTYTATTCGQDNGVISVNLTGGTSPYTFTILPQGDTETTTSSGVTFTGLSTGVYSIDISDSAVPPCYQTVSIGVSGSSATSVILVPTNPVVGNDGQISALISGGAPPLTLNWSSNVGGQTGINITNLASGTYTLSVTDNSGCTTSATTTLTGYATQTTYGKFNICESVFTYSGLGVKGMLEMATQGFQQNFGMSACTVTATTYTANVSVSGISASTIFYTGTSLNDVPSDELWGDALQELFSGYTGITSTIVDVETNSLVLQTVCSRTANELAFANVTTSLKINYYVSCNTGPQTCFILAESLPILTSESGDSLIYCY